MNPTPGQAPDQGFDLPTSIRDAAVNGLSIDKQSHVQALFVGVDSEVDGLVDCERSAGEFILFHGHLLFLRPSSQGIRTA